MTTFNKQNYLNAMPWKEDHYLVYPEGTTAIKRCKCCEVVKFTVEFVDNKNFIDGKLPVCSDCLARKSDKLDKAQAILDKTKKKQRCKTCKKSLLLSEFGVDTNPSGSNELRGECKTCRKPDTAARLP